MAAGASFRSPWRAIGGWPPAARQEPGMVKSTILIAAYATACIWLSVRRMEAAGVAPKTPRGRLRELGWGIALLALAISLFGLVGTSHWLALVAMLFAGLVLVLAPRQAAWLVAVALIALGLYGLYYGGVRFGAVLVDSGTWA